MPTVVETLEIQFRANTGNVDKAVRKTKQSLKGLSDEQIEVTADTKEAEKKLKNVAQKAEQAGEDANIVVQVDSKEALDKLDGIQKALEQIDTDIKIKTDNGDAERGISDLMATLRASGLLMLAKEGLSIGMNLVNTASDAEQSYSRLQGTLGKGALGTLQSYVGGLSSQYGFNETAIYDMASQFITLFKAYNYEEQEATDMGMRLIAQAIDYASFFNMTPSEVGQYFMSMLKGSYEVGDSIGMPLNATRLDEFAASRGIQGADELATRAAAFVSYAENNAELVGLAGDWERTADQFANVSTVLGEQWQTLQEKAGAHLLPAATTIAQGMSDILGAMIAFIGDDAPDMENIFGGMSLSDEQIQGIVQDITGPTAEINAALNSSAGLLDKAVNRFSQEYTGLMELLNLTYASGKPVDASTNDQIGQAVNALRDAGNEMAAQSEASLTSMLLMLSGDEDDWTQATETALTNIGNYFTRIKQEVQQQADDLASLIYDSVHNDGFLDAFELAEITQKSREYMQSAYEVSLAKYGGMTQEYIDKMARSGQLDAASAMKVVEGATAAAAQQRAELENKYTEIRAEIYAVAEAERLAYEKDPTAYVAKYGAAPATAQEMLADMERYYAVQMAQLDANVANQTARYFFPSMLEGMQELASGDGMSNRRFFEEILFPMMEYGDFAEYIRSAKEQGATLGAESLAFLDFYDQIMAWIPEEQLEGLSETGALNVLHGADTLYNFGSVTEGDAFAGFQSLIAQISTDFFSGEYQQNALDGAEIEAPAVESAIQESNGLLRLIAAKDFNITLNGYSLGRANSMGGAIYNRVLGKDTK